MTTMNQISKEQVVTKLKQYVTEAFLYDREDVVLTNDFPLIEQRVIDSMGIFRLITYLEGEFGATLPLTEIKLENFETIDAIAALMARVSLV